MFAMLFRLVFSLVVVLAVMAVLARVLKARQQGGGLSTALRSPDVAIRVLGRHGVGRTASVTVLQVGGRTLLLGVTESSVQVLRELSDEELESSRPAAPSPREAMSGPALNLSALLQAARDRTTRR